MKVRFLLNFGHLMSIEQNYAMSRSSFQLNLPLAQNMQLSKLTYHSTYRKLGVHLCVWGGWDLTERAEG